MVFTLFNIIDDKIAHTGSAYTILFCISSCISCPDLRAEPAPEAIVRLVTSAKDSSDQEVISESSRALIMPVACVVYSFCRSVSRVPHRGVVFKEEMQETDRKTPGDGFTSLHGVGQVSCSHCLVTGKFCVCVYVAVYFIPVCSYKVSVFSLLCRSLFPCNGTTKHSLLTAANYQVFSTGVRIALIANAG